MYGQGHQQGHGVYLNGGHSQSRYGGLPLNSKPFQNSGQHSAQGHRAQQDHNGQHSTFVNHQHNSSTPGFSATTPHFHGNQLRNGTPSHLTNGNTGRAPTEHWNRQLEAYTQSREAHGGHYHARTANVSKGTSIGVIENGKKDADKVQEERHRVSNAALDMLQQWSELDMGGQGLRALAPQLFTYPFLTALHLNGNSLTILPPAIGRLRKLQHLDLSGNQLHELPPELGMLVDLKTLLLFDNRLEELPLELGYLYQLDMLGIEGNPIESSIRTIMMEHGTKALIAELREHTQAPAIEDRETCIISEVKAKTDASPADTLTVMSYNILCDKMATRNLYGYSPQVALDWEHRRQLILDELEAREPDVLNLQEVDTESFHEYFRPQLAIKDYRGVFWPKQKSKTMREEESKAVDGCAIFYKHTKFVCLDKCLIDLVSCAISRPDMKGEQDIFNRYMPKDNIAVAAFLEDRQSGARVIMVNAHLHWDPAFADVKIIQTAVLMDEVSKLAERWSKMPACHDKQLFAHHRAEGEAPDQSVPPGPSHEYSNGPSVPLIICGDYNSTPGSGVHELLNTGSLPPRHPELKNYHYGNFTKQGMAHPFQLKSAYGSIGELKFTNYTPGFVGVVDYVWYATQYFQVLELLGDIDEEYLKRVPGFPNVHFPSDHIALYAKFAIKQRKDRQKPVDAE
ncbi:MAG: hypothetical protein Q9162_003401 [Coniocarpon cinnabarinum]